MIALLAAALLTTNGCAATDWPLYRRYAEVFIGRDGRVIDRTARSRSTSEGQAYALFHALVARDEARFNSVLAWTQRNLAKGNLARTLPAWLWGHGKDGEWRVLDDNAASDADLLLGYVLLEAARLFDRPALDALARRVLGNVRDREIALVPGLGPALLPGPHGFVLEDGKAHRLNPSYLPIQVLRRVAIADLPGPWDELVASSARVLLESASDGFAPDWTLFREGEFEDDLTEGAKASYDAIRVPLWAAMLDPDDSLRAPLLETLPGLLRQWRTRGFIPESVALVEEKPSTTAAPPGFLGALLPMARGDAELEGQLRQKLEAVKVDGLYGSPPAYYDQNLILFGLGFVEGRYRFAPDGRLVPRWAEPCPR